MLSAQTTAQYCENCVSQSWVPLQKRLEEVKHENRKAAEDQATAPGKAD